MCQEWQVNSELSAFTTNTDIVSFQKPVESSTSKKSVKNNTVKSKVVYNDILDPADTIKNINVVNLGRFAPFLTSLK